MQTLTMRTIQTKAHPQTKVLFWFLFAGSRGGANRIRIVSALQRRPSNTNQLAIDLGIDYKAVLHHMKVLEKNNLIDKLNVAHISTYFLSPLFEENRAVFDEIQSKMFSNTKSNNNFEGY